MKPKRTLALLLCAALLLTALSACGATVVVVEGGGNAGTPTGAPDPAGEPGPTQEPEPTQEPDGQPGGETTAVKTGLAVLPSLSASASASSEGDGAAQADILLVAVTVDDDGVIDSCIIDSIQAKIGFNAQGALTTPLDTTFATKDDYGMVAASSIGKEWYEQAAGFCQYVTGKSADDVAGLAVNGEGKAADADLAAAVTLSLGDFQAVVEKAAK